MATCGFSAQSYQLEFQTARRYGGQTACMSHVFVIRVNRCILPKAGWSKYTRILEAACFHTSDNHAKKTYHPIETCQSNKEPIVSPLGYTDHKQRPSLTIFGQDTTIPHLRSCLAAAQLEVLRKEDKN